MLLLWWCPFKIQKEKRAGLQFTSTYYLSLLLTPFRIRWAIPFKPKKDYLIESKISRLILFGWYACRQYQNIELIPALHLSEGTVHRAVAKQCYNGDDHPASSRCSCCISMSMLHFYVNAASMLHVHLHAASHAHAACPCSCCMPMLMLHAHAHAACHAHAHAVGPQTEVLWTSTTFPVLCKGDVNRASRNAVDSLMA